MALSQRVLNIVAKFTDKISVAAVIVQLEPDEAVTLDGRVSLYATKYCGRSIYFSSLEKAMVWAHLSNIAAVVVGGTAVRGQRG